MKRLFFLIPLLLMLSCNDREDREVEEGINIYRNTIYQKDEDEEIWYDGNSIKFEEKSHYTRRICKNGYALYAGYDGTVRIEGALLFSNIKYNDTDNSKNIGFDLYINDDFKKYVQGLLSKKIYVRRGGGKVYRLVEFSEDIRVKEDDYISFRVSELEKEEGSVEFLELKGLYVHYIKRDD